MMEERGQITIEAVLIFGLFIVVLVGISWPMAFRVKAAADDVEILTAARYATEQIASAADTIVTSGGKRTIDVYVPGFRSVGNTTGSPSVPLIHIITRICSPDGKNLNTTVLIVRRESDGTIKRDETHTFNRSLYGTNWGFSVSGDDAIVEDIGKRYTITLYWKNITSSTSNTLSGINCNASRTELLSGSEG
ncbi:MAG: hypothetical protein ACE5G7_06255 [Candidatus Hydrothermarchaeaceae archaeon]